MVKFRFSNWKKYLDEAWLLIETPQKSIQVVPFGTYCLRQRNDATKKNTISWDSLVITLLRDEAPRDMPRCDEMELFGLVWIA